VNGAKPMRTCETLANVLSVIALGLMTSIAVMAQATVQMDQYGRWVNGVSEPWYFPESISKEVIGSIQKKWSADQEETNARDGNEWEGTYFTGGDTHGSYLRWSQRGGFVLMDVDKCAATVMGFSYGKVISSPNLIQILPEKAVTPSARHSHGMQAAIRFLPVSWQGKKYLVSEDKISEFCDYVAGLGKYNDWAGNYIELEAFFSKLDKEVIGSVDALSKPARIVKDSFDAPIVPPGYERFIRKPIVVTVIALGRSYRKHDPENEWWDHLITPLTMDVGQARVRRQMKFRLANSDETIQVTKVSAHISRGIIVRSVRKQPCVRFSDTDDCTETDYPPIEIGLKASTSPFR
jgi:hypothetical protein